MTRRLTFARVARLERTAVASSVQSHPLRERLIAEGAIVPAELAVDGRALHSRDAAHDRPVLKLDALGHREAKRRIVAGEHGRRIMDLW